ncbi:MAG: hypothetical protein OEV74_11800 [Cyclobacteriaceae bacterium]|nr:hypothetical protein [Cyclobacteriaceae bacterium]
MRAGFATLVFATCIAGCAPKPETSYRIESIPLPDGLAGETGAVAFLPDGRLVACFLRGEVMFYDPKIKQWHLFAEGLHEPLGVLPMSESEVIVMQRPELTRLVDTDGDGHADLYETLTDDFGMTGNYHEWNYGPVKDKAGNLFVSFNTASEYGAIMKEVRGRLDTTLVPFKPLQKFSAVPWRGWIMKFTPEGKLLPYASGFRSPNGLGFDQQGNLFATDNQGDWVGTSAMFHVQPDKFYGHPASLLWLEHWDRGDPSKLPVDELNRMRTKASVLFPHGIMSISPGQPVVDDTSNKFGPFAGQFFVGEMNQERIMRVLLEEVDGEWQGACMPFIDGHGLRKGNNRLAFAPDGSLWVGQVQHGFVGDRGIQRIEFTGRTPMDIYSMNITPSGFDVTFTQPVDPAIATDPDNYAFQHYYYEYHLKYGSDQYDVQPVSVSDVKISPDNKKVSLALASLKPGYVYELNLSNIKSASGEDLANKLICYTVNKLKK